ncbi:hypothetical protein BC829DRAFT_385114 [Chytridium lagenaria]|nr:hypothetical protein BC829DRAFT_385114 [Chytridium lagenaria]
MKDLEQCPLCFYIPNRAKLLTCCNDRLICSLCARSWLRKSDTCPFCRSYIPYTVRKHGLPDSDLQNVIDGLDVVCPYADGGCSWIGVRRDVKAHLKECVVAIDPETGHPAPGLLRISDFCLDEKWSNTPQRTTADAEASAASRSSFLPSDEMRSRRDSQFNDASSTRRLTAVSPARLEGGEIGESVGGRVRDWFVRGFRAFYVGFLVIVVVFVVGLLVAVYQNRMG